MKGLIKGAKKEEVLHWFIDSRADDFNEFGISPNSFNHCAFLHRELPEALNPIIVEVSFKELSISKYNFASPLFGVLDQHSLVIFPVVFKQVKVSEVKTALKLHRIVIVDFSKTVELILAPIAFICQFASFVKEFSPTVHLVVLPLTLVVSSVLVEELALTVSFPVQFVPFITRSSFIFFHNVLMIGEIDGMFCISDSWRGILWILISYLHNGAVVLCFIGRSYRSGLSVVNFLLIIGLLIGVGWKLHLVLYVVGTSMYEFFWVLGVGDLFLVLCECSLYLLFLILIVFFFFILTVSIKQWPDS